MMPLTDKNIESELSYAYLHAVASQAGVSCTVSGRHEDNAGVDAKLVGWGPFPSGGYRTEVDIKVQLKATIKAPTSVKNCLSYSLSGTARYDDLRTETISTPRILVVLFLPALKANWIEHTDDALLLKKCAYWVSLRGALASTNDTAQTVYLPKVQRFDTTGLLGLLDAIASNQVPTYAGAV